MNLQKFNHVLLEKDGQPQVWPMPKGMAPVAAWLIGTISRKKLIDEQHKQHRNNLFKAIKKWFPVCNLSMVLPKKGQRLDLVLSRSSEVSNPAALKMILGEEFDALVHVQTKTSQSFTPTPRLLELSVSEDPRAKQIAACLKETIIPVFSAHHIGGDKQAEKQ